MPGTPRNCRLRPALGAPVLKITPRKGKYDRRKSFRRSGGQGLPGLFDGGNAKMGQSFRNVGKIGFLPAGGRGGELPLGRSHFREHEADEWPVPEPRNQPARIFVADNLSNVPCLIEHLDFRAPVTSALSCITERVSASRK